MRDSITAEETSALRRQRNTHSHYRKPLSLFGILLICVGFFASPAKSQALSKAAGPVPSTPMIRSADPQTSVIQTSVIPAADPSASTAPSSGPAVSATGSEVVILSSYKESMRIGRSRILVAATSAGRPVTWTSTNPRIAFVDSCGVVTGRKAGSCQIIARTDAAEARCTILVKKRSRSENK